MVKRYFFVSYSHPNGFGNATTMVTGGNYLNAKEFATSIGKTVSGVIIILSIVELTEEEHIQFNI